MKLSGKIALVTGASKGIGRAIAIGLAQEGASVGVNYSSDLKGAMETVKKIEELGVRAVAIKADISKKDERDIMFKKVLDEFGGLDIMVNNAAVTEWTPLFETTEEKWDKVMNINLKGTFFCCLEAAKIMKERGGGNIINVSSNCERLGVKNLIAYSSSKGGIHAMTRQLACELAEYGIRVNTMAPGPTNVERNLTDDPEYKNRWKKVVPLGRTAEPEEMAGIAVFLASNDSSYMTGQIIFVDGGWTVQGRLPDIEYFEMAAAKRR
ncbi:MAG TPA: 3-oxoacyl-ACP reductase FabG [Clostridiaceae bacterium]|nr:3-oxoacyl-ACP reductase FabG [Clostridiaceae bacterium]